MAIQHWMTFGTFAEQRYYIYPNPATYDGIIFNGNMATHAPDGLAGFLIEKTRPKMPYIIDPLTHAFQHDPTFVSSKKKDGTVEIKAPIKTLSSIFGEPIASIAGNRPLLPNDLVNEDLLKAFTERVLDFQKDQLSLRMEGSEVNQKYLEHTADELTPTALVAPYFYMTETSYSSWLPLMVKAVQFAKGLAKYEGLSIYSSIVISQGIILDDDIINEIVAEMRKSGADGYLFWVDGLDEQSAGGAELKGMLKLAKGLRGDGKALINLHGGYFSLLAAGGRFDFSYFTGVAHGAEFGESRKVIPVGGGIPIAKYYLRALHKRVKYNDATFFLSTKGFLANANTFHSNVCDCEECKATLNGDAANFILFGITDSKPIQRANGFVTLDYPTKETKEHCLKHFLQSKVWEYNIAVTKTKEELIADLDNAYNDFLASTGLEYISYLQIWKRVLTTA